MLGIDTGPGIALFDGVEYRQMRQPFATVGVVLDASGIHPGIRAYRHLSAVARAHDISAHRVSEVLDLVGLTGAREVRSRAMSLGMRQRLAIATALLSEPRVLVLDEPTNGLDPHGIRWLGTLLRSFADTGGTVLLSSHLISEVAHIADRVEVIVEGRLVASGTTAEIAHTVAAPAVLVTSTEPGPLQALLANRGAEVHDEAGVLRVTGLALQEIAETAKSAPGLVLSLHVDEASLETAYFEIAGAR